MDSLANTVQHRDWDTEFRWLCRQRAHYPPNADVWHLRFHWSVEQRQLAQQLRSQRYRFGPVSVITKVNGETLHLRSARDALVAKRLARGLLQHTRFSSHCTHLKGHGGLKATVAQVQRKLPHYRYVLRTDIKQFYAHIDHEVLLDQLDQVVNEPWVMNLLGQCIARCAERGGTFRDITRGIARGCPLSPVFGALYLQSVDAAFVADPKLYYVRYMDDLLVLAPSRWSLRRAKAKLHRLLQPLKLDLHPDKTYLGRIDKGFDFLGYHHAPRHFSLAEVTRARFHARCCRLYEQHRQEASANPARVFPALDDYVRRWRRWARAGLGDLGGQLNLDFATPEPSDSG